MIIALLVALILALVVAGGALWHAREQAERANADHIAARQFTKNWIDAVGRVHDLEETLADAERRARRRARRTTPDAVEVPHV